MRNTNYLMHMKHNLQAVYRLVHHGGQRLDKKSKQATCKLQCPGCTRYPIDKSSLGYMISWDIIPGQEYPLDLVDCCASWVTRSRVHSSHPSRYSDWQCRVRLNDILWMIFAAPSERLDFKDTNFVGLNHSIPKHYGTRQQI